jgi:hypothetical protein
MVAPSNQCSPEVRAEARRMAASTVTAMVYEYVLTGAPAGDNQAGITFIGQSVEPCMAPPAALLDRDTKHAREAQSHPNKPFSRAINTYGKAAFNHGKGPCVLTKVTAKRLAAMAWANEKESELIVARGGPWRDGSYGAAQTLNAKRGGQGDPWRVLCGIAKHKLKARGKLGAAPNSCAHGRRHRECKECGGAGICEHGRRRRECKECGGAGVCEHGRQRRQCKECGGAGVCEHGTRRHMCKECGGAGVCEHGRLRHECKECGGAGICEHGRLTSQWGAKRQSVCLLE